MAGGTRKNLAARVTTGIFATVALLGGLAVLGEVYHIFLMARDLAVIDSVRASVFSSGQAAKIVSLPIDRPERWYTSEEHDGDWRCSLSIVRLVEWMVAGGGGRSSASRQETEPDGWKLTVVLEHTATDEEVEHARALAMQVLSELRHSDIWTVEVIREIEGTKGPATTR